MNPGKLLIFLLVVIAMMLIGILFGSLIKKFPTNIAKAIVLLGIAIEVIIAYTTILLLTH